MTRRALVIGAGVRGREHADALRAIDGLDLEAVVDPDPGVRSRTPGTVVADLRDLRDGVRPDVVVIATPPATRAAVVAEVLATVAPRAVVCEKPLAVDPAEAAGIVGAAADAGALLAVGHHWRFQPGFDLVRAAVADGRIGAIDHVRGTCFGNLLDQGGHVADALRWLTGAEVEWVLAAAEDDPEVLNRLAPPDLAWWTDPDHPAPAWLTAHGALADGCRFTVEAGLLQRRTGVSDDDWRQAGLVLQGTEGVAEAWASGAARVRRFDGRFEQVTEPDGQPLAATVALHRAVLAAMDGEPTELATGVDGLASLAVVDACIRSAAGAGLVRLAEAPIAPLRRRVAAATARVPASASVVINVDDPRGWAAEAVRSWRHEQAYPGDVELVLVSGGEDPALDDDLRRRLAPTDRYLVEPGATRIALWDAGARAARGEVVVLTEAHCVAEPGCLGALLDALGDPRVHGAAGRTGAETRNAFSVVDADAYATGEAGHAAPTDWRVNPVHAFAIRRATFLEVGGFRVDADLYAEQLLVASLRARGFAVVDAPSARVRHRFADGPAGLVRTIDGLARGQARLRALGPPGPFEAGLFPAGALDPLEADQRAALAALAGAVADGARLDDVAGWVAPALLAPRPRERAAAVALAAARARGRLHRAPEAVAAAYAEVSARAVVRARRDVRVTHGAPVRSGCDGPGTWPVEALGARLSGAHDLERHGGVAFRWLRPAAALVTDLPPGDWRLVLHTGGIGRDPTSVRVRARLDGRRIDVEARTDAVVVEGRARRGLQVWTLVVDALAAAGDDRRLGLPLAAVTAC